MSKTFMKELIIVLLLCLAIILLLGILLYKYNPMTKTLPNEVSYSTPEEISEELATSGEERLPITTYSVGTQDLDNYRKIQNYRPGKTNPFSSYTVTSVSGEEERVKQAYTTVKTNNNGTVTLDKFKTELQQYDDKVTVEQNGDGFKVKYSTGNEYTVKSDGSLSTSSSSGTSINNNTTNNNQSNPSTQPVPDRIQK